MSHDHNTLLLKRVTYTAVAVVTTLIIIKAIAWAATGSLSVQATLIDSVLDALTSLLNLFAVREASRPADKEHRFGHGKVESLSALGQAAFITGSAFFLLWDAGNRSFNPRVVQHAEIGIFVMIISMVMTFGLIQYQTYAVKKTNSLAIAADSLHYRSDLVINAAVIGSLILSQWFNMRGFDPALGAVIAVYILFTAWKILLRALDVLMDRELPDNERDQIRQLALSHAQVEGLHDLRTRSAGAQKFIQFHLEMADHISFKQAHDITVDVENKIKGFFPQAEVIIHQDLAGFRKVDT